MKPSMSICGFIISSISTLGKELNWRWFKGTSKIGLNGHPMKVVTDLKMIGIFEKNSIILHIVEKIRDEHS